MKKWPLLILILISKLIFQTPLHAKDPNERQTPLLKSSVVQGIIKDDFLIHNNEVCNEIGESSDPVPCIAIDSLGNFVLAWEDGRNSGRYGDIYGQRFTSDGQALGMNFRVNDDPGLAVQFEPAISMDKAGNFVVVWVDRRDGTWIYVQRYNAAGQKIGANFKVDMGGGATPDISHDKNGGFTIVWVYQPNFQSHVYARRYAADGQALAAPMRIGEGNNLAQKRPAISHDAAGNFVVTWESGVGGVWDIYAQRFDNEGQALADFFQVDVNDPSTASNYPDVSCSPAGDFVVSWRDPRDDNSIYAQLYDSSGQPHGDNFRVNEDTGTAFQGNPAIEHDGAGGFVVVWDHNENFNTADIYAQRFNNAGQAQGNNYKITDGTIGFGFAPAIGMHSDGSFVTAWRDFRGVVPEVYAQRVSSSDQRLGDNFPVLDVPQGCSDQIAPVVDQDSSGNFVVVWEDTRNGDEDIYARLFSRDGVALGDDFKVSDAPLNINERTPAVSRDAFGNFVVVWEDFRNGRADIYAQRFDNNGVPQGVNFLINDDGESTSQDFPVISLDPQGNFVVVWYDNNTNHGLYARRFDSAGQALGSQFKVDQVPATSSNVQAISHDADGGFVVAWAGRGENRGIYAQRYSNEGQSIGDNFLVSDVTIATVPKINHNTAGNFVIVWREIREIYARRFDSDGQPQGSPFRVDDDSENNSKRDPVVDIDATGRFIVVWEDRRFHPNDPYIVGQRFDESGNPVGENAIIVAGNAVDSQLKPAVSANADQIVFAWEDNRGEAGWDIYSKITTWNWEGITGIDDREPTVNTGFRLLQNYPNPFNPETYIRFELQEPAAIRLVVYNVMGKMVRVLVGGQQNNILPNLSPGIHEVRWDGLNYNGQAVSSGIYFYVLESRTGQYPKNILKQIRKMVLIK